MSMRPQYDRDLFQVDDLRVKQTYKLSKQQEEHIFSMLEELDKNPVSLEPRVSSTRGRKPRAIHNPYFTSEIYGSLTTEDLEDVLYGVAWTMNKKDSHKGCTLNWHQAAKCVLHFDTFTSAGIASYLKVSERTARRYMNLLDIYTDLVQF